MDPDLSGAWNYIISGHKYWAIFPPCKNQKCFFTRGCVFLQRKLPPEFFYLGVASKAVQCNDACPDHYDDDVHDTLRWFKHVLPKLRHIKVFLDVLLLLKWVNYPGIP